MLSLASSVWGMLLALVTIPVMLHGLGLTAYGIYTLAFSVAGFAAFMDIGLGWTVSKFVAEAEAQRNTTLMGATVRAGALYYLVIGFLFVAAVVPSADWIVRTVVQTSNADASVLAGVIRLAAMSFFCSSLGGFFVSTLRGMRRFAAATFISMVGITASVAGAALAAWLGFGVLVAATTQVLGASLGMGLGAWTCHTQLMIPTSGPALKRQLREMLGFSFWTYLNRIAQVLVFQADKVLIGRFGGMAFLPIYTVPFGLAQKINFLAGPAVTAIYPTAAAGQYDRETFMRQYSSGSRVVHILTAAAALAVLLWGGHFLTAWVGAELAEQGIFYLRVLAVGYWVVSVGSFDLGCIEAWNRPKLTVAITSLGLVFAILTGFMVSPILGTTRAIAVAVSFWMVFTGVGGMVVWQRLSRYSITRFVGHVAMPVLEMGAIGWVATLAIRGLDHPRLLVIAILPILVAGLALYGYVRAFTTEVRQTIFARLTGSFPTIGK